MTDHLTDAPVSPERLDELIEIYQGDDSDHGRAFRELKTLRDHVGIEFLFNWMRTPNPMLGNISPEQMIKLGRGHTLIQFIHDAQEDFEALPKHDREPPHCPTCECEPGSWGAKPPIEPFVVKHYSSDERPTLKGNGFDGFELGETREEAQHFVDWVNERLGFPSSAGSSHG